MLGMTEAQAQVSVHVRGMSDRRELIGCFVGVDGSCACVWGFERDKGIRWMPWHQEAMKDVARCEKPWGAASRL